MFDYLPGHPFDDADPRLLGIRFLVAHRAALARVAAGMRDEEAAALAHALTDMMIDPAVDQMHWPVEETIALLRRRGAAQSGDAELLAGERTRLRDAIDVGGA
ncbi:MAG TPA: hypothetical protein PLH75_03875 [Amaricoccus sp.]|uniref:hypothetical protein n=1 Tax=Amaricoccus sp. TaxID=1872485 RepID=UPI002CC74461|nr:hypothetical protein [Amaricoccus sp.]HPG21912.1 hypothetical protein [Amaricoccus sp.]HRW15261.1 hypothetical protein [Amaricoccus sp.]